MLDRTSRFAEPFRFAVVLLAAALLAGCNQDSGTSGSFNARDSVVAVSPDTPIVVRGTWAAYLADEETTGVDGTDMNRDGDRVDSVATVVDIRGRIETVLNVAAIDLFIVADQVYFTVDEQLDARDWNGDDLLEDIVLLNWSLFVNRVRFVDTVGGGPIHAVASLTRLYYVSDTPANGAESTLRYLRPETPIDPIVVMHESGMPRDPRLLGIDSELLLVYGDETVDGLDLNGDGDMEDGFVLELLDATDPQAEIRNVGLAMAGLNQPIRARRVAPNDWLVGFLVSEEATGNLTGGGFNDPALFEDVWQPPQCEGDEDQDLEDNVLHYLYFLDWSMDPVTNAPVNTGLVGRRTIAIPDSRRPFVATISRESEEGTCDLNDDGDISDAVVRWVEAEGPSRPFTDSDQLLAVANVAGGARSLGEVDFALFAAVSESAQGEDIDGDGVRESELLGWINIGLRDEAEWILDHNESPDETFFLGIDWLAENGDRDRVLTVASEAVAGGRLNLGDDDLLDSIPIWAFIDDSEADLDLPGESLAVEQRNAGIVTAEGSVFFRGNEGDDNTDWNGDGDERDSVLFSATIEEGGSTRFISTLNRIERPAVETGPRAAGIVGGVFITNEAMAEEDLNRDGDRNDWVVRFFNI